MNLTTALGECERLLSGQPEWGVISTCTREKYAWEIRGGEDSVKIAIACVNLLREHGAEMRDALKDKARLDWLESLQLRTEPCPQKNSNPWAIASDVHLRKDFASVYVCVGGIAYGKGERDQGFHGPTLRAAVDAALPPDGAGE